MPDFRSIVTKRCPVSFDWEGEKIEIAYKPYSEKIEQQAKGEDGSWNAEAIKSLLTTILLDWNLTTDGLPTPITLETLTELPTELVFSIFYVVLEDVRDPKMPKTHSRSGLRLVGNSEQRPTGT